MVNISRWNLVIEVVLCLIYLSSTVSASCPNGWVEGINSCYRFVTTGKEIWSEAQNQCGRMDGRLATIESWNEFYWMKGYIASHPQLRANDMWIGGYNNGTGNWFWRGNVVDVPMNIPAWITGNPDNYWTYKKECITIATPLAHELLGFDDRICNRHEQSYVCEIDMTDVAQNKPDNSILLSGLLSQLLKRADQTTTIPDRWWMTSGPTTAVKPSAEPTTPWYESVHYASSSVSTTAYSYFCLIVVSLLFLL